MKIMKKSLLALALISTTANLLPHGGGGGFGGGFATGAILGTGITLAATSGSRNSESPESRSIRSIEKEIKRTEREIDSLQRKIDTIKYKNKRMSKDEKADKLADLQGRLDDHKENVKDLRRQRAMVTA